MSKQPNPTLIGGFVVGAIVLLVIAIVLFGGAAFFAEKNRYTTYFEGSVQGLRVGADVTFRGVRVGYVTDVRLQVQTDSLKTLVPVTIEVVPGAFQILGDDHPLQGEDLMAGLRLRKLIDAGLRAQLNVESYVTGQLLLELDFIPDQPALMRGVDPSYPEIPTIPNDIEQVIGNIERLISTLNDKVDIDAVLQDVQGMLRGFNELANSPDLRDALAGLRTLINSPETQQLSASINMAAEELDTTLQTTRAFIGNADQEIGPVVDQLAGALKQLRESLPIVTDRLSAALTQIEKSLLVAERGVAAVEEKLRDNSEFSRQLDQTLGELERAARSVRIFLDYLEQHPDSLIRGKRYP